MNIEQIEFSDTQSTNLSTVTGSLTSLAGRHSRRHRETDTLRDDTTSTAQRLERIFTPQNVLLGRETEVKQLQETFHRISTREAQSEVVLLGGSSGSGKTSLVETSLRTQVAKSNGFFVAAKCEQVRTSVPFPSLTSVLSDLCDLVSQQEDSLPSIRARVTDSVGHSEAAALSSLVSNIGRVTGHEYLDSFSSSGSNMTQTFQRFKVSCKLFVRSIASLAHPIVIFLDDLQWIDHGSRGILRDLVADKSCNLLLIGAYRHDEATSNDVVEMFEFEPDQFRLNTMRIVLSNLDKQAANEMIATSLGMAPSIVSELSDVVYSKTDGNPFYTKELLDFLMYKRLIRYHEDTEEWVWDAKDIGVIRDQINVAENLLGILEQKLHRLPPEMQKLLTVASYIGFFFRENVLTDFIVEEAVAVGQSESNSRTQVKGTLRDAIKEGVIEEVPAYGYRFAHDKIQQSVLETVKGDEHVSLSYRLGWFLHARIPSYGQQAVFLAAENLIKGFAMSSDAEERLSVARICLTAGLAAKGLSSFHSAAEFAGGGLHVLGPTLPWATQHHLVLALCTLAVECRQALGNIDETRGIIAQILENANSHCEKWPAHKVVIEDLATSGDFAGALQKSLMIVREYGDGYPKKPNLIHVVRHYLRVKRLLKRMSDDDLLSLPKLTDANLITTTDVYKGIHHQSFLAGDEVNFALSVLRGVEFSIKHGYSMVTPACIVCVGLLCCSLVGDVSLGNRYGELAVRMLDHWNFVEGRARVYLVREGIFFHLRHTAKACAAGLKVGVLDGFKSGEHEDSMYCTCLFAQVFMAATSNLLGESEDPVALTSDIVNEQVALQLAIDVEDKIMHFAFRSLKASLLFHFGDVEAACVYAEKLRKEKHLGIQDGLNLLYFGLTYVDMYRRSVQKRKHLSRARRLLKELGRGGGENPNTKASFYLLDADLYAISSKTATIEAVLEKYDLAATKASEGGLLQFEALANERAALAITGRNLDLSIIHMARAKELYLRWDAVAIVEYLDRTHMTHRRFDDR